MARRWTLMLSALLPIVACILVFCWTHPEPEYQGKKLSYWLVELSTPRKAAAEQAIREMGSNAVPFLCRELLANDSNLKLKWLRLAQKQQLFRVNYIAANDRHEHAREALMILGPVAKPAIPTLIEAFKQGNVGHHIGPYEAFPRIGKASIPPLLAACTNENKWVRFFGVRALQKFPGDAPAVVPQLIWSLNDSDPRVRYGAIGSLMQVRDLPEIAVPAIGRMLKDEDAEVRELAAEALGVYGRQSERLTPALSGALEDKDPGVRGAAAWAIVKSVPEAAGQMPRVRAVLNESLSSADTWLATKSREALKEIHSKGRTE